MEKKDLELSRIELEKKYSLVVNSHQWLLQELCQILKLVESFRHELAAGASMSAATEDDRDGQHEPKKNAADDVVDTGLEQIERLIGALVHLDHDVHYIEDVDVYGCYEADVDKLVSLSKRLQRSNQTLQYELRQSVHENMALNRQVEQLEKIADAACRLQEESDALRNEYDQLVNDVRNFKDHVSKITVTDNESIEFIDLAELFEKNVEENEQLKRAVNELLVKVDELESAIEVDRRSATDPDEKEGLAARYRQFSIQLDALQQANMSKEDENKRLSDSASELTKKVVNLESELKNLHVSTADMEATLMEAVDENKRLVVAKQQLSQTLSQLQTSVNSSTGGMEAVIKELNDKNSELLRTNEALEFQISSLEKLQQKNAAAEDLLIELESLRLEKRKLEDQVYQMNEAISRQSQMILNLDEELRGQRGNDVMRFVHQNASSPTSEQQVLQKKSVSGVNSSCQTSTQQQDVNKEQQINSETLQHLSETKKKVEDELRSTRRQVEQLVLSIRQYEEALQEKTIEIDRLQAEITELKKKTNSEKEYYQRKLDSLHKEHSVQYQKLRNQNETLTNELLAANRQREQSLNEAEPTSEELQNDDDVLECRQQAIMSGVTVSQIMKLFAAGGAHEKQEEDEAKRSKLLTSGTDAGECDGVDGSRVHIESDDVEWCEQKLLSDLAKAVDASQMLLNENRRLRQEIDKLMKLRKRSQTEDDTDMTEIQHAEMENLRLKNYIEELESKVSALKKTIEKQGMCLEDSGRPISTDTPMQYDENAEPSIGEGEPRKQESSTQDSVGLQIITRTPESSDGGQDLIRRVVGAQTEDDKREVILEVLDENQRLRDDVERLSIEMSSAIKELEAKQAIIQGLESFLTKNKESMKKMEQATNIAQDYVSSFESIADEAGKVLSTYQLKTASSGGIYFSPRDSCGILGECIALTKIQQLLDTFKKIAHEKNDLLEKLAFLQENSTKQEVASEQIIKELHIRILELEQADSQRRRTLETSVTNNDHDGKEHFDNADIFNGSTKLRPKEDTIDSSRHTNDIIAALASENEEMRRLLESRAPQLEPDFEERLMAEVESLSSECKNLRRQLANGNKMEGDRATTENDREKTVIELRAQINRLREENRLLRRAIPSDQPTKARGSTVNNSDEKSNNSENHITKKIGDDRRQQKQRVNDEAECLSEPDSSAISSDSEGRRSVVRRVSISGVLVPLEPDQPDRRQSISNLSTEPAVDPDHRRRCLVDRDPSDADVVQLRRRCRHLENENEALRNKMATAWKVSVQHAVSRNVGVQTTGDDLVDLPTEGTRRLSACDDDIYLTYCSVSSVPRSTTPSTVSGHNLDTDQLVVEIRRLTRMLAVSE